MIKDNEYDDFILRGLPPLDQRPEFIFQEHEQEFHSVSNVVDFLFKRATDNSWSERPFLRSSKRIVTYHQASKHVNQLCQILKEDLKLISGNRVLLRGTNSIGLSLCWLAVVKSGLIVVTTMPLLRSKELIEIANKSRPSLALCENELLEELQNAQKNSSSNFKIIGFDANHETGKLAEQCSYISTKNTYYDTDLNDIALLAFTSGTTGKPKAAAHTHKSIISSCYAWPKHVLQATPDDIMMGSPSLAFTFGLGGLLIYPMFFGSSVYYPSIQYSPETLIELMKQIGCTICFTAPTFYRQLIPFIETLPLPSLKKCISAGEPLLHSTRELWKKATNIEIIDGIGTTELFHIFISSGNWAIKKGSLGKVVPGYTAKVVNESGEEVPRGTMGFLAIKGPTGCLYFDDDRQAKYVSNGWNYPGDSFIQDENDYFYYQTRADEMIITSGYNVSGMEVEETLMGHPYIKECAVIGENNEHRGMIVKAYCVLKVNIIPSNEITNELQQYVKNAIAPYKYPREIEYLDTLPRTPTGKIQRYLLKKKNA